MAVFEAEEENENDGDIGRQKRSVMREERWPERLPDESVLQLAQCLVASGRSPSTQVVRQELRDKCFPKQSLGTSVLTTNDAFRMTKRTYFAVCLLAVVRSALVDDVTSTDDAVAVEHLSNASPLSFRMWTPEGNIIINTGDDTINHFLTSVPLEVRQK